MAADCFALTVTVTVKNTGSRFGRAVAQLYVRDVESSQIKPVRELKGFEKDSEEPRGLARLFASAQRRIERMKASYSKVSVNVDGIQSSLELHQAQLLKDVAMFVAKRLSPLESVVSTATHFVLRRYKQSGVSFLGEEPDERGAL